MKKFATLLTLAVVVAAFAGCSGGMSGGVLPVAPQLQAHQADVAGGPPTAKHFDVAGGPPTRGR